MLPTWVGAAIVFVYGAVVGSFLNVCIFRLPQEKSVVRPASFCPKCGTKLGVFDLVPLFSFLFSGKKCRYCGLPISWRYFTIELITAVVFVACYLVYGFSIDFFAYVIFLSALIVAFAVDIEHMIIPDEVSIIGVLAGVGKDIAHYAYGTLDWTHIYVPFTGISFSAPPSVVGALVCGGLFFLLAFVTFYIYRPKDEDEQEEYEGAMGMGDVKLAAATGAVLGLVPALVSFLVAIFLGTLIGVIIILVSRSRSNGEEGLRTAIPFGPYMVLGSAAVIFAYPQLGMLWQAWVHLVGRT